LRWLWAYPSPNQELEKDETAGETVRSKGCVSAAQKDPQEYVLTGSNVPPFDRFACVCDFPGKKYNAKT